jgi:3-hydroxyisobutyrate dehydrogenase-like beta-hydroxyacid dehydrogenase
MMRRSTLDSQGEQEMQRLVRPEAVATIGFIGFGEVASCFAEALQSAGARVVAYDLLLAREGGRERLASRARAAPPEFLDLHPLVERADLVVSTVTADVAVAVARHCAPLLSPGQVYVDLNATSPAVKRQIAAEIARSHGDFVEGAILPAIGVMGAKSQVLLCGARAGDVARAMTALGLNFSAYGEEIGRASSFKMLRSVFSKGLEALLVECRLAARHAGVEDDLWREIVATLDAASFDQVGGNWVRTHGTAHARRYHEMVQVASVLEELGVDAPMTEATVRLFERSTRVRLSEAFPKTPAGAGDVIRALDERLASPKEN